MLSFKSFSRAVLLMAFLGLLASAQAMESAPSIQKSFTDAARSIPQALLARGYRRFGPLDLQSLLDGMKKVNLALVESLYRPERIGDQTGVAERSSAQWVRDRNQSRIEINKNLWLQTAPDVQKVIALHEYLGANAFEDGNYVVSTALWMLTQERTYEVLKPDETRSLASLVQGELEASGGVTGVGGGGDEDGAQLKMRMLTLALERTAKTRDAAERQDALRSLHATFYHKTEILRRPPKGNIFAEGMKARIRQGFESCQNFIALSPQKQTDVFNETSRRASEDFRRAFPSRKVFLEKCREMISEGLEKLLQQVEK